MAFSKAVFAVLAGMALSSAAMGQDQAAVSAEKTSGIKTLVPGAYGALQVRHYTFRKQDNDGNVVNDTPRLEARPIIGTTLFDDKVDTAFMWIFRKVADSTAITRNFLVNITQIKTLEGKNGYIGPYAETYQANGVSFNESYVGIYGEGSYDVPVSGGTIVFNGWTQDNAILKSQRAINECAKDAGCAVEVQNRTGRESFGLAEGDVGIPQRDPSLFALNAVGVKFKPAALPAFSVGTEVEYEAYWKPKYDAVDVAGDDRYEQDGYATAGLTISKFILGYKLNDKVTLTNSLRHMTSGFYGAGINADTESVDGWVGTNRWENRLIMSASLF